MDATTHDRLAKRPEPLPERPFLRQPEQPAQLILSAEQIASEQQAPHLSDPSYFTMEPRIDLNQGLSSHRHIPDSETLLKFTSTLADQGSPHTVHSSTLPDMACDGCWRA